MKNNINVNSVIEIGVLFYRYLKYTLEMCFILLKNLKWMKNLLFVFVQRLMGSFKALWTFFCTAKLKKRKRFSAESLTTVVLIKNQCTWQN